MTAVGADGVVYLYQSATGTRVARIEQPGTPFGTSVAIAETPDRPTLFVGEVQAGEDGVVRVVREEQGAWQVVSSLQPSRPEADELFGAAIATESDVVYVGAPGADAAAGGVYVFAPNLDGVLEEETFLQAMPRNDGEGIGRSLDASHSFLFAGAPDDSGGAAVLFRKRRLAPSAFSFEQFEKYVEGYDGFGHDVAVGGPALVATAPDANVWGDDAGKLFVYNSTGGGPPVTVDDSYTISEGGSVRDDPTDNDSDPDGDPLRPVWISDAQNGSWWINPDNSFHYDADPGFVGTEILEYAADDGCFQTPGTITIEVTEANPCGDSTCADGETCYAGACFPACADNASCPEAQACFENRCAAQPCDGIDCTDGEVCYGGSCFPVCEDGASCPGNQSCFDGRCADSACASVQCPVGQVCYGGSCFDGCDGESCPEGLSCFDNRCASSACEGVQCSTGEACFEGTCFPSCATDADCPDGQSCTRDGVCTLVVCPEGEGWSVQDGECSFREPGCQCSQPNGKHRPVAPVLVFIGLALILARRRIESGR